MPFVIKKLNVKCTIGEELFRMRRERNLTLAEMAEKTKIRRHLLEAIEKGRLMDLPEPMYSRHMLKTYVKSLGGNEAYFLNRFKEEWGACDLSNIRRLPIQRTKSRVLFSPSKILAISGILAACLSVVTYLGIEVREITAPPDLQISSPDDGSTTDKAIISMFGKTKPNVTIKVNGNPTLISKDGSFDAEVTLERGLNIITIEGTKRYSRTTRLYRHIIFQENHTAISQIKPVDN